MELIAEERRDGTPAALAYGAYQHGTRLRVGLLLVRVGQKERRVTFADVDEQIKISVLLPPEAIGNDGHGRFNFKELEIV